MSINIKKALAIVDTLNKELDASDSYAETLRPKDEVPPSCWEICNGKIREVLEELDAVLRSAVGLIDGTSRRCTGIRDKNGELIFEGHVLKSRGMNCRRGAFEVQWETFSASFVTFYTEDKKLHSINEDSMKFFEIIGNVYDNPDLLENETGKGKRA